MFGAYVKQRRIARDLSLREFCRQLDEDPSNWSKIERGVLAPPRDEAKLKRIAGLVGISVGAKEWRELTDLASVDAGAIPEYIVNDREIMQMLPAFFRTVGSVKPTKEELEKLLQSLRKAHSK